MLTEPRPMELRFAIGERVECKLDASVSAEALTGVATATGER